MQNLQLPIFILLPLFFVSLLLSQQATAHRLRPAIIDIQFNTNSSYQIHITTNVEALLSGMGANHTDTDDSPQKDKYNSLRQLPASQLKTKIQHFETRLLQGLQVLFDNHPGQPHIRSIIVPAVGDIELPRLSTITLQGETPQQATHFNWSYDKSFGNNVLKISKSGSTEKISYWLTDGKQSPVYRLDKAVVPRAGTAITKEYVTLGYTHILPKGLDHILFVLGIFLLCAKLSPLLWQITAFTLAHTITLGLTIYGFIALPSSIIEPLIALSIVYIGIENSLTSDLKPWRIFIVFGFGLLHGMGFAGVLSDIGLPRSEFLNGLISFNVGVELGQLSIIVCAYFLVAYWFKQKTWYRKRVVIPGSLFISATGLYWTVERIL